jgi:hypothetical protein
MSLPSDGVTRAAALLHPYSKQRVNAGLVPTAGRCASLAGIDRSPHAYAVAGACRKVRAGERRPNFGENCENLLKQHGVFLVNAGAIARYKQTLWERPTVWADPAARRRQRAIRRSAILCEACAGTGTHGRCRTVSWGGACDPPPRVLLFCHIMLNPH